MEQPTTIRSTRQKTDPKMAWRLALLTILLLAFSLRVHRLDGQSLWYDEAVTAQVVQQGLAELARWTADDIQPPLYYALLAGWTQAAGANEWALRFPSAAFGLLAVALLYALAGRLFAQPASLIAVLLGAVHPLWIYYSQEARMYAMLTALGLLAGYALLRVLAPSGASRLIAQYPERSRGTDHASRTPALRAGASVTPHGPRLIWWAVFVLSSIALLYTHYFTIFLLLACALYFLIVLATSSVMLKPAGAEASPAGDSSPQTAQSDKTSARCLLLEGLSAALIIFAAYLPWLPNALRRFQVDASYWSGRLKLNEAIRHIAISFSSGETVLEQQAIPLAWAVAALAGLCLLALLLSVIRDRRSAHSPIHPFTHSQFPILFVLLYLFIPIIAILALAYRTPKFNPRYLMLASPGLLLLLAGGLALPFQPRLTPHAPRSPLHASRFLALAALIFLMAVSLFAVRNWFDDPAFSKDDWRGVVAYVRSQLQPDEGVVLVSGHAYPAWRTYAPDIEPLRLPDIEILDVNAVLDLERAAAALNAGLAGKQGAWLLQWQEEVVDPTGVTPLLLELAGDEQPVEVSFWGLGAPKHVRFQEPVGPDGATFSARPPLDRQVNANFAGQVELLGFSQPSCDQPACPVYLYWRALAPLEADYKLSATLQEAGVDISRLQDRRLAAYDYPTFRWPPGQIVVSRLELAPDLGTPPAESYSLRVDVYDDTTGEPLALLDEAGNPQGIWAWLQPIAVAELISAGPGGPSRAATPIAVAPQISLLEASLDRAEARMGEWLTLDLWWEAPSRPDKDYELLWFWLESPNDWLFGGGYQAPAGLDFPTSRWPAQTPVHSRLRMRLWDGATQEPGLRRLRIGLQDPAQPGQFVGEHLDLVVERLPFRPNFDLPVVELPASELFGGQVELLGVSLGAERLAPGATLPVTVAWRSAAGEIDTSYSGFVHLLDGEGRLAAQDDHIPRRGERPTTAWLLDEIIEDGYELLLPAGLLPGTYRLEIGLYDALTPGLPRLTTAEGQDSVILGAIEILAP